MSSIFDEDKMAADWHDITNASPIEDLQKLRKQMSELTGESDLSKIIEAATKDLSEAQSNAIMAMTMALMSSGHNVLDYELVTEIKPNFSVAIYFRVRDKVEECGHDANTVSCSYCGYTQDICENCGHRNK